MMEDFNTPPNVKESGTTPMKLSIRIMVRKDQKETSIQIYADMEERIYAGKDIIVCIRVLELGLSPLPYS